MADIAIVGAGLVGAPLACVLANQGWRVVLLDASDGSALRSKESASASSDAQPSGSLEDQIALQQRCTALSLGTKRWFSQHGLWQFVQADAAAIGQVVVSHKGYFGATRLQAEELDVEALGYVVNNQVLTDSVLSLVAKSGVEHRTSTKVISVEHHDEFVALQVAQGATVRARLLIAADGVTSAVRESLGIGVSQVDYQQAAVLTTIRLQRGHGGVAHERFTETGPLALLPRKGPYMSVVDCIDPTDRESVSGLDDAAYLARLQSRFGFRLGRFSAVGTRMVVPLIRIEAAAQTAARAVLLGNAMRLLHPVGGQGYNLAMRDAEELRRLLSVQLAVSGSVAQADPGGAGLLADFVAARQRDQQQIVQFTDRLARGFRGKAALPGHLRSAALLGLDVLGPLRRSFAQRSMGLGS